MMTTKRLLAACAAALTLGACVPPPVRQPASHMCEGPRADHELGPALVPCGQVDR